MATIVCRTGEESTIREALEYLKRRYDIPAGDIRSIAVQGEVGQPILITVTVYQQAEPAAALVVRCPRCGHEHFRHRDEDVTDVKVMCLGRYCACTLTAQDVLATVAERATVGRDTAQEDEG